MKNLNHFAIMRVTPGSQYDMNGKGQLLCIAEEGFFASSAWIESDEAFSNITGRSFGITTGDDNNFYKEDKSKMFRPTEEEVLALLPKCHIAFQEKAKRLME